MAPPPVTPSPHRFVIKQPKRASHPPRPPSVPSSQQFNATPRFHVAPSQRYSASGGLHREEAPLVHHYSTPARLRDVIEEEPSVADSDALETVGSHFAHELLFTDDDDDEEESLFKRRSSKRRRLSPSPILESQDQGDVEPHDENVQEDLPENRDEFDSMISSITSTMSSPPAEVLHRLPGPGSTTAPRFVLPSTPAHVLPSTPATTQAAIFVKPPRFRPPDGQEQQQRPSEPLPDAFSPQRRGHKFLAGGLAAEVIGWVMNLDSSATAVSSARSKEDTWAIELLVDEVRGGPSTGMTLISGRQVLTGQSKQIMTAQGVIKVILAGSGTGDAFQKATRIEIRNKVRIKSPIWEVVVEGEKWGVAVAWETLS